MVDLTRRKVLVTAAGASAVLATTTLAVAANVSARHSDAVILDAWASYVPLLRMFYNLSDETTDEDHAPYYAELDRLKGIIDSTPAVTSVGMGPKLHILLVEITASGLAERAMFEAPPADLAAKLDDRDGNFMLWNLIQQSKGVAGATA
jgi:hypothetical protein